MQLLVHEWVGEAVERLQWWYFTRLNMSIVCVCSIAGVCFAKLTCKKGGGGGGGGGACVHAMYVLMCKG